MKKIMMMLVLGAAALTAYAKDIKTLTVTPEPVMTCEKCEAKIKGNLRFEKGVKKVETNLKEQTITVTYDADKTTVQKLEEAFAKMKYKVTEVEKK